MGKRKLIYNLILFLIFALILTQLTIAESKTIEVGQTIFLDGNSVTLLAVGKFGSARLNIDGEEITLHSYEVYPLGKISLEITQTLIDPISGGYVSLNITQKQTEMLEKGCSQNRDCDDSNPCTTDICKEGLCENIIFGCLSEEQCLQAGDIKRDKYCSKLGTLQLQKISGPCEESYECKSNNCINSECSSILIGEKEGFFTNLFTDTFSFKLNFKKDGGEKMHWIFAIIGLYFIIKWLPFLLWPNKYKRIITNCLRFSDNLYRILAVVFILIGLVLLAIYFI